MEEELKADPFLQLLTDALRAGPGSPEWHQAVARVRAGETGPNDEYALLVQARENLANGKSYREVRAGAGFTRKVMANFDKDAGAMTLRKSPISASLISYIGAGLIVGAVGVVIFWMLSRNPPADTEDLTSVFFKRTVASATFDSPLPAGWKLIGPLPLDPTRGLAPPIVRGSSEYTGGAVVSTDGISPKDQFAVEATFQFSDQISPDVIPQLFVTDDPNFSPDKATSPHELVWMVRPGTPQNGQSPEQVQIMTPDEQLTIVPNSVQKGQSVSVRIVVGAKTAAIMSNSVIVWSGPNQLSDSKPRFVGVRLLCRKESRNLKELKNSMVVVKDLNEFAK